jgi:hypothetical protein
MDNKKDKAIDVDKVGVSQLQSRLNIGYVVVYVVVYAVML